MEIIIRLTVEKYNRSRLLDYINELGVDLDLS